MCSLSRSASRVVEGLKQILVVLDHLAAHVNAKPLLVRAMHHRNELVVRVLDVLVVLAVLVPVVLLAVQEGDDEREFEPYLERVRPSIHLAGAWNQVIAKQRPAPRGVDENVSR